MIKNVVPLGEAIVKHEFVYQKHGVTTFECRELISREANGAEDICVFKAVFGPREEHAKHKHTTCDEIVFCVSGRGVEGIETSPGKFEEFEYAPGTTLHLPRGVGHYTRNPDYFRISTWSASLSACPTWTRRRPVTCPSARSPTARGRFSDPRQGANARLETA